MKRPFEFLIVLCCFVWAVPAVCDESASGFIHPGISHNQAELDFVQSKLKTLEQPWHDAWTKLRSSDHAALTW